MSFSRPFHRNGDVLDVQITHTGPTVRITVTADDMPAVMSVTGDTARRMAVLTALASRIHVRRTGARHVFSCDVPAAQPA